MLDLYEGRTLYGLTIRDLGATEDAAEDELAKLIAKHFWNPFTIPMDEYVPLLKSSFLTEMRQRIRFIDQGKKLKLVHDAFEPTLEEGCEPVQIAYYYDESVLLVDKSLWDQLTPTHKMGLFAHEMLYFMARESGTRNSMSVRKLVGRMFSTQGARPRADGAPEDTRRLLNCDLSFQGVSQGNVYLYENELGGRRGLELLFFDLRNHPSIFRTSAFLPDLSFAHMTNPEFRNVRESALEKDTYPVRDRLQVAFQGSGGGTLRAQLKILQGAGTAVADEFALSCPFGPDDVKNLVSHTTEAGVFEGTGYAQGDRLVIRADGTLTLTQVRQVGGPGGASRGTLVPYPTVCRTLNHGVITQRDEKQVAYVVNRVELGDLDGLNDTAHCAEYVRKVNEIAVRGELSFSAEFELYKRVE